MLIKYTVITTGSLVLVKPNITKYDGTVSNFIVSKEIKLEDVIKVLCGESFTSLTSVDLNCINEICIDHLKKKERPCILRPLRSKIIQFFIQNKNQCLLNSLLVLDGFDNHFYIIV